VPTVEEVEPWVETIIRLWDDGKLYRECSDKAKTHARRWHPDRVTPRYVEFFKNLVNGQLSIDNGQKQEMSNPQSAIRNPQSHGFTSIVIVTHNQLEFTHLSVASIEQHTTEPHELILIDNASTDGTVEYLKSLGEQAASAANRTNPLRRVTVVVNTENQGFPKAANQGIQAATGQQIVLINNDTIVTAGWLTRLLRALEGDPTVGMVGPVSNFVSGPQQIDVPYEWRMTGGGCRDRTEEGSGFGVQGSGGVEGSALSVQGSGRDKQLDAVQKFARAWGEANTGRIHETDRLVGFCLLIKREVVEKIGLLDERFGIGNFEDDDYCRRAREAGYRLVIARDAFVHHFGGATFIGAKVDHGAVMRENERLFLEKWAGDRVQGSGPNCQ
jgi:GT2 family glycosyltransferase